jgi:hypothetical protein
MVLIRLPEADFLELGLSYAGFNAINQLRTRLEDISPTVFKMHS